VGGTINDRRRERSMSVELENILNGPRLMKPKTRESDARRVEKARRAATAQGLAKQALTKLYPDEYRELFEQAKARVAASRGPLPE
jgi:hypothetical protein